MLKPSTKSSSINTEDISVQKILKLKVINVHSKVDFDGGTPFSLITHGTKKKGFIYCQPQGNVLVCLLFNVAETNIKTTAHYLTNLPKFLPIQMTDTIARSKATLTETVNEPEIAARKRGPRYNQ
jgi:hypothetical protein